jgi:hypothetical protein
LKNLIFRKKGITHEPVNYWKLSDGIVVAIYQGARGARPDLDFIVKYKQEGKDTNNIVLTKKIFRKFSNSFTLSVFNAYNRYNPYFIYITRKGDFTNGTLEVGAKQVSLFPILPSFTWNFKF